MPPGVAADSRCSLAIKIGAVMWLGNGSALLYYINNRNDRVLYARHAHCGQQSEPTFDELLADCIPILKQLTSFSRQTNHLTYLYRVVQKKIARILMHRHFATVCSRITRFSPNCSERSLSIYQSMQNFSQLIKYSLINSRNWIHV